MTELDNNTSFGHYGHKIISSADSTGTFGVIQALEDTTLSYTNLRNPVGAQEVASYTLLGGMIIYGTFTNITISSGKAIAYYNSSELIK